MDGSLPFELRRFGGSREGPNLLITAGVHGDEFLPMLAVNELIRQFEGDKSLQGSLTLIPIVNRPAVRRGHRCGDDGLDLARTCPGREDGTETERIAFHLSREIENADYYIDLHTGGTELCVLPMAGYVLHPDKAILDRQRALARAFGLPFLWGTSAELEGRSLSVARDAGVPAIYVEYLGAHRERAETSSLGSDHPLVVGCMNVLRHLGMIDGAVADTKPRIVEDWRCGSGHMQECCPAPTDGFLKLKVALGDEVEIGDLIAEIDPGAGHSIHQVVSQQNGTVILLRDYPRIHRGDAVAVIAEHFEEP